MSWNHYSCVEEIDHSSASNYLEYMRATQGHWGNEDSVSWYFRGQADIDWSLTPRAWRPIGVNPLQELTNSFADYINTELRTEAESLARTHHIKATDYDEFVRYIAAVAAEHDSVKHFSDFADELAHPIDGSDELISGVRFIKHCINNNKWPDVTPTSAYGIAQHHGIPTILMDWSRKPLIAAFFAAAIPSGLRGSKIAIWGINVPFLVSADSSYGLRTLNSARANDSFLHAQDGLFIWHQSAGAYRKQNGSWPSLLDAVEACYQGGEKPIRVVSLPHSEVIALNKLLWRERISLAHLMPTHDNIAKTVTQSWSSYSGIRVNVTAYGEV